MQSSDASDRPWHRVLVIGCPGAGKTAFARKLAKSTGLPLKFSTKHHPRIVKGITQYGANLRAIRLRNDREAEELLASVGTR